jgi:hypothetical protein
MNIAPRSSWLALLAYTGLAFAAALAVLLVAIFFCLSFRCGTVIRPA